LLITWSKVWALTLLKSEKAMIVKNAFMNNFIIEKIKKKDNNLKKEA
tara:strand:- start:114 stop:254 length:141 start_codon:yes stop_codon:yes gene_type:complete